MAQIKYYIEPSAFDRGFSKAVEHHAEWNAILIDLGGRGDKHQCYSIRDGHVEASSDYLKQCYEITLENYKEIAGDYHISTIYKDYLREGEVVTVFLDSQPLDEDDIHFEVYDKLPGEVDIHTEDGLLIMMFDNMMEVANLAGFQHIDGVEMFKGRRNAMILPKAEVMALYEEENKVHDPADLDLPTDEELEEFNNWLLLEGLDD